MSEHLYPIKFRPILKDKLWGGSRLGNLLNKPGASDKCGESWEISGVEGDISVVANGFLKGNPLTDILEIYMDDLVGEKVYQQFGNEFPLLIKYIDAEDALSIQVHPDDELSRQRHNAFGKTEMWYVMEAEKGAELIVGFKKETTREEYISNLENKTLGKILNSEPVASGDVFYIPAGRVHAIGKGILLAEIQQTSDVTYRIYDFDRKDEKGNLRELHTELALDAIDFKAYPEYKTNYKKAKGIANPIISCPYFITNLLVLDKPFVPDYSKIDSFVIYMCVGGRASIKCPGLEPVHLTMGETVLIPAILKELEIIPDSEAELLEVFL